MSCLESDFIKNLFPSVEKTVDKVIPFLPCRPVSLFDVGANFGLFSEILASKHPVKEVFLFEPVDAFMSLAILRLEKGFEFSIRPYPVALGNKDIEKVDLYMSESNLGWNTLLKEDPLQPPGFYAAMKKIKVPLRKLDRMNLPPVDLFKIDVEGYEGEVLRGALEYIEAFKPILLVEVAWGTKHHFWKENLETYQKLFDMGYSKVEFSDTTEDVVFLCEVTHDKNSLRNSGKK